MIKQGDILVCICERESLDYSGYLTLNEKYLVTKIKEDPYNTFIFIKCNKGIETSFHIKFLDLFFITLAELREQQIKSVLDD